MAATRLTAAQRERLATFDGRFRFHDTTREDAEARELFKELGLIHAPWPGTRWLLTPAGRAALEGGAS